MKIYQTFFFCLIIFFLSSAVASSDAANSGVSEQEKLAYKERCLEDLEFLRKNIAENSAPIKDPNDKDFKIWFDDGYKQTKILIDGVQDRDDCYYAMKFYVNGFGRSHVSLRGYILSPPEKYPGILTLKDGDRHVVVYKDNSLIYLKDVELGSVLTEINGIKINDYFEKYILPFYANDDSEYSKKAASLFSLIVNGNRYVPIPITATFAQDHGEVKVDLKYTELTKEALAIAKAITQPDPEQRFKVEVVSNGVWIAIPTFYLSKEESVFYTGMLSKLRELAKEDYIVFDLRGNRGGATRWSRPIIRNLWGDDYIKSLGKDHDYNSLWIKKVRISKQNFFEFKKTANAAEIKAFAASMQNGEDFFEKKWKIYNEDLNLYTAKNSVPFKAKIYVLTDHFCRSTCWAFVNELKQIPSVTHVGLPTAIQTNNSYAKKVRSPSEDFDFFYPTEIRIYPNRNVDQALIPSEIFDGDIRSDKELTEWIISIAEKEDDNENGYNENGDNEDAKESRKKASK